MLKIAAFKPFFKFIVDIGLVLSLWKFAWLYAKIFLEYGAEVFHVYESRRL